MLIPIDDQLLTEYDLSPDEYYWLFCQHTKALPKARYEVSKAYLMTKGYIDTENALTQAGKEIFGDSKFEEKLNEFWMKYPQQVLTKMHDVRILRPVSLDSHTGRLVRKLYRPLLKKHDQLMSGLNRQIETTDIQYFQRIETWLRQHTWEKFMTATGNLPNSSTNGEKVL